VKAAVDHYGFDRAFLASEFDGFVREFARLTNKKVKVWCEDSEIVEKLFHPTYGFELKNTESPKAILDMMRSIKSPSEIALMRQSCKIASEAFQQTIKYCAEKCTRGESISEHQMWAKIDYECRMQGADR
jgi:Xaa-Pro aminopeptidase